MNTRIKTRVCFSAALAAITLAATTPPAFSLAANGETDRDAELLVVGNYPAKNLTVSESDLDDIVAQFSAGTVPIKIEHIDSPLDPLGTVSRIWREGKKLLGRIGFDPLAVPLLSSRPVKGLSVGLDRDNTTKRLSLAEVSLVLRPHVPSAALLHDDDPTDKVARLEAKLRQLDCDTRIAELKRQGKIVPAIELHARRLLMADDGASITLSDGSSASVSDAAFQLLTALPPLVKFGETGRTKLTGGGGPAGAAGASAMVGEEDEMPALTPDQIAYCRDVLKVDPARVVETIKQDRQRTADKGRTM